ncbi:MAG: glycosyltransferase family 2 protein [Victivallaceae bacterium]
MSEKLLVSVIVPMYEVEKYLSECLDSVVKQTLRDIEIILIDDGSPDRCGEIADEYASRDSRVTVVHQKNHGVGQARNVGLAMARGEFVYILDSDDWLASHALERMYNQAVETGSDIVMINYLNVYPGNIPGEGYRLVSEPPPPWLKFAGCGAWLRLLRRDWLSAHSELFFPEDIWTGQDMVFSLMLDFFTDKLHWLDEPLLYRRHRAGSKQQTLHQQRRKVLTSVSNAFCFWRNFMDSHPDLEAHNNDVFIFIFCNLLTYTKLPLWFKVRKVWEYRRVFCRLNTCGKVDWRRTPRVWCFWKYGIYVPPTRLRSLWAKLSGQRHRLADQGV